MDVSEVERVFWTACEIRVKRTLDGRHNTVRRGWQRVGDDVLHNTAGADDPAHAVEQAEEQSLAREFAATLGERERRVLRVKYYSGTAEPLGYKKIAQHLGISIASARAADRAIKRQLEHFAAIYTAGKLCPERQHEVAALAAGVADSTQRRLALAHVAHCAHCKGLPLPGHQPREGARAGRAHWHARGRDLARGRHRHRPPRPGRCRHLTTAGRAAREVTARRADGTPLAERSAADTNPT